MELNRKGAKNAKGMLSFLWYGLSRTRYIVSLQNRFFVGTHGNASTKRSLFVSVWLFILSACGPIIPATTPPQLDYTPGPPAIITDDTYDAGPFKVRYPRGWQVITPAAFSTTWVVFTNNEETALIVLALDANDTNVTPANLSTDDMQREERTIPLENDAELVAVLVAPSEKWDYFISLYEQTINSIK